METAAEDGRRFFLLNLAAAPVSHSAGAPILRSVVAKRTPINWTGLFRNGETLAVSVQVCSRRYASVSGFCATKLIERLKDRLHRGSLLSADIVTPDIKKKNDPYLSAVVPRFMLNRIVEYH